MKPRELANRLPSPTGDAAKDLLNLRAALVLILRQLDSFDWLQEAGGDVLIGNRLLAVNAGSGFLKLPTIDGSGPPTGTPANGGAGDPIVRTRDDGKLWIYSFERSRWEEFPESGDDNEILELLLMILQELTLQRGLPL